MTTVRRRHLRFVPHPRDDDGLRQPRLEPLPAVDEVSGREELTAALREDLAAGEGPQLIQIPVASGMWME